MCDSEEADSCLPSILSWVRSHAALGGSGTDCVGRSRSPSQSQSSRHQVKALTDPQPLPAPPHKHSQPYNLPQMDIWGQVHHPSSDYLSSALEAPAGGKRGCTEEKQMSTRDQWVRLCCQSLETTSAAQKHNCSALHQRWQLPHALFPCVLKRLIPIHLGCGLLVNVPGRHHLPERHSLNTPSFNIPRDLLVWYDGANNSGHLSSYDHSFPL